MEVRFGAEKGGTPIGDRKSLEVLQKEVMEREKKIWEAKQKAIKAAGENKTSSTFGTC
jgi:hypothetical protein